MAERVVVAYDVGDDARRNRVARVLMDFGVRVQYSVFECTLTDAQLAALTELLRRRIDAAEDRVSFYPLCGRCTSHQLHLGREPPDADPQYVIL